MKRKLDTDEKVFIGIASGIGAVLLGKGIYECLPSTKEKRSEQRKQRELEKEEWNKRADEIMSEVNSELSKTKEFTQGDLIAKIADSNRLGSNLKGELISTIKMGRNVTDDSMNKAIYKIAMNPRIYSHDTVRMVTDIMNAHPKTDTEIICDSITDLGDELIKYFAPSEKISSKKKK